MANEEEVFDVGDVLFSWACFFGGSYSLLPRLSDSPRRQEIQAPSITCFAEDPPSDRKAGPVDDDGYRPSSFFLFLFPFFFFFFFLVSLSVSLSLSLWVEREGVFASMTIVNSSIDLHRWPRALIIFHGEFCCFFYLTLRWGEKNHQIKKK